MGVSPVGQSSDVAAMLVMERAGDSLAFHPTTTPLQQPSRPLRPEHQGALSVVNGSEMFRLRQVQAGCDLWPIDAAEQLAVLLVGI